MDIVRFTKLFTALYTDNAGTRDAAGKYLYDWMVANRVHPDDLAIDVQGESQARSERVLKRIEEENTQLRREIAFYRANAEDKLRTKASKAGLIENRWDDFAELIKQRLKLSELTRGWQAPVRIMTGVSKIQLTGWQKGLVRIPDTAFEKMRSAEVPNVRKRGRPKKINGTAGDRESDHLM